MKSLSWTWLVEEFKVLSSALSEVYALAPIQSSSLSVYIALRLLPTLELVSYNNVTAQLGPERNSHIALRTGY
ncbi:5635_t:CDS:2 [Acaulospora colombiana]|uniref:5635_t:CDS:1 n=1 Tax=Acaulospora colombiana TaxID=27376 RepID=A0ACA9L873_9GLOM|nr:5635_t:CDS:2 [Acaulospora colombiana]